MRRNYNFKTQQDLLANLSATVKKTTADFLNLANDLSEEQLRWKPAEQRWSIAECVSHLLLIDGPYQEAIEHQLKNDTSKPAAEEPYKTTWIGRLMLNTVDPATTRRVPTAGSFMPVTIPPDLVAEFVAHQQGLEKILDEAKSHNLNLVRITSPVSRLLRFRLGECLHFLVIHQVRHLNQANRVRSEPQFPAA